MLHQHGGGSSIQGIDTDKIKQNLVINADSNATVDVKVLQPDLVHIEHNENIVNTNPTPNHNSKDYWIVKTNKPYGTEMGTPVADSNNIINQEVGVVVIPGAFAQAVYTSNDGMWMYKNQKITKIVATWSDLLDSPILNCNNQDIITPTIGITSDPSEGFWYNNSDGVTVNYQFYDEKGNLISFNDDAYLTISSLNNNKSATRSRINISS